MKICFITHSIFNGGGVQRVLSVLASKLVEEYVVDIICTSNESNLDKNIYNLNPKINVKYIEDTIGKIGMEPIYCKLGRGINKYTNILNKKCFVNLLSKMYFTRNFEDEVIREINKSNYDIVIGVEGRNSMLLGRIKDKIKCKTVGWQHNSYDAYFRTNKKYIWHQDEVFRRYASRLDKYVVLTDDDKEKIKKRLNLDIVRIYNPLSFSSKNKSKCINKKIISVGRITSQKGFDLLIKAFKNVCKTHNDWSLEIVGDGEDKEKLENLIKDFEIQDNVKIKPFTKDIVENYVDSSIFVSSSRWEGFGLVITEAMECGLPVIAFNNSGPKEIINKENGILVDCEDIEMLSNEINSLIENKFKLSNLSKKSIKRASDFNIENIIRDWTKMFETIM